MVILKLDRVRLGGDCGSVYVCSSERICLALDPLLLCAGFGEDVPESGFGDTEAG